MSREGEAAVENASGGEAEELDAEADCENEHGSLLADRRGDEYDSCWLLYIAIMATVNSLSYRAMEDAVPTPPRTSLDAIVRAGAEILDADGLDALTMQRVAAVVGVRPPSLYKRVRDRDALVRLIAAEVLDDLGVALSGASPTSADPRQSLLATAHAFRAWVHRHPGAFALLFSPVPEAWRLEPDQSQAALVALLRPIIALAGPEHVLEAARTVVAWASGFVSMELAGAFRLGGDVDAAFAYGVERLAAAIESGHAALHG